MKKSNQIEQQKIEKKLQQNEWFQSHFYIIPLIEAVVFLWFSLFIPCVNNCWLLMDNGKLTSVGVLISIALPIILAAFIIKQGYLIYYIKHTDLSEFTEKKETLYTTLLSSFLTICQRKSSYLVSHMGDHSLCSPESQFQTIFDELKDCLAFLLAENDHRINFQDMHVDMLCQFDDGEWFDIPKDSYGMLSKDFRNNNSFFSLLQSERSMFLFKNSKQQLFKDLHYIPDERDVEKDNELQGSILGYRIKIQHNNNSNITALLFVSTFTAPFVRTKYKDEKTIHNDIETAKHNIQNIILKQFEPRLKIELCNLYNLKT